MSGVNTIIVTGRLGGDAERRDTQSGVTRLRFSMAHKRSYSKDGERVEQTSWMPVSYYGKSAEAIEKFLIKGKEVTIVGRLDAYEYEKDGERRKGFEIIANEVWLGAKSGSARDTDEEEDDEPMPSKASARSSSSSGRGRKDEESPW